ncbi:MAG: dephospho-CoA kinase [Solirubrobacteraceae bacterium]
MIGLTGGIGSGKSTALAALKRNGAAVLSTDRVVHELYETFEVREALRCRFDASIVPAGVVDRGALAERAFAMPADRAWLEGLLWPRVGARIVAWHEQVQCSSPSPRAAVVEVPLLFESEMEDVFDATIAILADEKVRSRRAAARGHRALEERSARQLSQEEKAARATYVVANDSTVDQFEARLSSVLDMLDG